MSIRRMIAALVFTVALMAVMAPASVFAEKHAGTMDDPIPMTLGEYYNAFINEPNQEVVFEWKVPDNIDSGKNLYFESISSPALPSNIERQGLIFYGEGQYYNQYYDGESAKPDFLFSWNINDEVRTYLIKVRFKDERDTGVFEVQLRDTPSRFGTDYNKVRKPTDVKAVAGKRSMTVTWKSAGCSDFKYKVTYSAKGVKAKTVTVKVDENNYHSPSVKIKNLKKGKKYTVKVQAITYDGYKSDWSKKVTSGKIK
ncbi:MAG: fibronectin type III domain-containing protein [Eubacterium sp.]|nr:fibronectin type III domain-containing protein [Eubacterium sp.]